MRRRTPLFSALDLNQIASGLQPDLHPLHRTLWDEGQNVVFGQGKVKRREPSTLAFSSPDGQPIRGLAQQQLSNGQRRVWFAAIRFTGSGTFAGFWNGVTTDIPMLGLGMKDETALAPASFVDFTSYGDWMLVNIPGQINGKALLYKAADNFPPYAQAPSNTLRFIKKLSFVLAIAPAANPRQVAWSDSANIEDWTPRKENAAGSLTLEELDTPIRAAEHLGDAIAVYSEDQMALVRHVGAPFYFVGRLVLNGIGAVGKMAVCSDGRSNYGVGRNGVWWTDGISYQYIDEGLLSDYLQSNVNWGQKSKIAAARNDVTGCIEFSFPMGFSSEPNEAWAFDPRNKGWSKVPAFTVKDERKVLDRPLAGTAQGLVLLDGAGGSANNPLSLITKPLMMQAEGAGPHQVYRLDEVTLLMRDQNNVQFRLASSHQIDGVWEVSEWQDMVGAVTTYNIYDLEDGVYFRLEFRSTAPDWKLNLQGFMLYGTIEGASRD